MPYRANYFNFAEEREKAQARIEEELVEAIKKVKAEYPNLKSMRKKAKKDGCSRQQVWLMKQKYGL